MADFGRIGPAGAFFEEKLAGLIDETRNISHGIYGGDVISLSKLIEAV